MKKYLGYLYIVLSAVIFSTMEVVLKTVAGVFAPMQITALRFTVGGLLLLPLAIRSMKNKGTRLGGRDVLFFCLTGFLNVILAMGFYQVAVTMNQASAVAVLFSANPIFTLLLAGIILKESIRKNHIIALILEIIAIVIFVSPWNTKLDLTGVLLALLAAVVFGLYSVVCKLRTARFGGIAVTSISFVLGGFLLILLILLGRIPAVSSAFSACGLSVMADVPLLKGIPASALPALFYICAVVTAGGYVFHMLAVEKTSAREGGLVFFLKPMIAPVLAYIFLKDEITVNMILGIICLLIGSGISIIPDILRAKKQA